MCNCPQYGVMYIHHSAMYIHHVAIHIQHITVAHEHQITQCSKCIYQSCICCICICSFVCCCSYCSFNWCSAIRASINLVFVVFVFVFMCVVAVTGLPIDAVRYAHLSILYLLYLFLYLCVLQLMQCDTRIYQSAQETLLTKCILPWSSSADHTLIIHSSFHFNQLFLQARPGNWLNGCQFFSCLCRYSSIQLSTAANIPDLTDLQIYNYIIYATLVPTLWGPNLHLSYSNGFLHLCFYFLPTFSLTPCALNICVASALQ